jgi:hypothetical protein
MIYHAVMLIEKYSCIRLEYIYDNLKSINKDIHIGLKLIAQYIYSVKW